MSHTNCYNVARAFCGARPPSRGSVSRVGAGAFSATCYCVAVYLALCFVYFRSQNVLLFQFIGFY